MATTTLPEATRALYPFKSHHLTLSDGKRMHYVDEGPPDGDVLVFVHGYPTWSFIYRAPLIYYAAQGYRCVAMDHIGWGLSDKPTSRRYHTLRRHIYNFIECLDALDVDKVTLVMEDWGAILALGYALRRLARVRRLVIMNAWVFQESYPIPLSPFIRLATRPGIGELLFRALNLALNVGLQHWSVRRLAPAAVVGYKIPFRDARRRTALYQFPRMISTTPTHPSASLIREIEGGLRQLDRKPTLIVWGQDDGIFPPPLANHWAKMMPHAQGPVRIERARHFLMEDAPEAVLLAMDDFFAMTSHNSQ
ncbi:MAG: alpha/beta fold hydrolase [Chloroflexi bacterium]|nr:alpha/beta fold hydrolase [Chloroflexota bacterium]